MKVAKILIVNVFAISKLNKHRTEKADEHHGQLENKEEIALEI